MTNVLVRRQTSDVGTVSQPLSDASREYARRSRAKATVEAYDADFKKFIRWCMARGSDPMPADPSTVADYLTHLANGAMEACRYTGRAKLVRRGVSTIDRHRCAIAAAHRIAVFEGAAVSDPTKHPVVQMVWEGIRRTLGVAPRPKDAITPKDIGILLATLDGDLRGVRDKAMLLLALCGAFRRSELCGIEVQHLKFVTEGVRVALPRSKTDQEGVGRVVPVLAHPAAKLCPVRALQEWLSESGIHEGPVFRGIAKGGRVMSSRINVRTYVLRIKEYAVRAGLDPDRFAGHSLRAGFVTGALQGGAQPFAIMDITGHRNYDTLKKYIREASMWSSNAGQHLQL